MESVTTNESCNFDYNWDELSVGNFRVDDSGSFFVQRHPEHEKMYKEELQRLTDEQEAAFQFDMDTENNQNKDNVDIEPLNRCKSTGPDQLSTDIENLRIEPLSPAPSKSSIDSGSPGRKKVKNSATTKECKEFNVVRFVKLYDIKKKAILNAVEKREREQRQFHSKPAPNFHAIHAAVERKRSQEVPKITYPVTPSVIRRHLEAKERMLKRKEEYEAAMRPKPFISNANPDVLRRKPFVPQIEKCHIQPVPFNLHSDMRLKERRQYDENVKMEAKRRQQEREEQLKREEEEIRRELRKATTFKAQPNPFK